MTQTEVQTDNGASENGAGSLVAPSGDALKNVLESLIFVSDGPVTAKRLARAARATLAEVQPLLDELVADYLGVELGGRYSSYDNAGTDETYKLGLQWAPLPDLRFRGMFQRSVRAPNLLEAFQETLNSRGAKHSPRKHSWFDGVKHFFEEMKP